MTTLTKSRVRPVRRKTRSAAPVQLAWLEASQELGIDLTWNDLPLGPVARGLVNQHDVMIALGADAHRKHGVRTTYRVRFEAPGAPNFKITKRFSSKGSAVDTGDRTFDSNVTVVTDNPVAFRVFMTSARREAVVRMLTLWPLAEIRSNEALLSTDGLEDSSEQIVDSICHLVATAETFDRQTVSEVEGTALAQDAADRVDVGLDEAQVLQSLFGSGLEPGLVASRFEQVYRGQEVTWSGEVLTVGPKEDAGRRIIVLVGSADGNDPESGRVVALTLVPRRATVNKGDIVSFSGTMLNLDARRRLFRIE